MKFRTSLALESSDLQIDYNSKLVLLGSCFSENIGQALYDRKFTTLINPLGISYNPMSILKNVNIIAKNRQILESDLQEKNDRFFHYDFHGSNNTLNPTAYADQINKNINKTHAYLKLADVLFISLGTANVFTHNTHGIVNNCHKMPNNLFTRRLLSIVEITDALTKIKSLVQSINPKIKLVFTVSPIRHIRDGLIVDRRSKSLLIASLSQVINDKDVFYFPSYELLIDDLRDYRFYKEDLIHPSDQAIRYIWEYFSAVYFSDKTKELIGKVDKINSMLSHKIMNTSSEASQKFIEKIKIEIENISNHIPQDRWGHK